MLTYFLLYHHYLTYVFKVTRKINPINETKRKIIIPLVILFSPFLLSAQPTGIFKTHADIGNPQMKGGLSYDPASQVYTIKGAGYNVWFERDEFHYAYNSIKGDF